MRPSIIDIYRSKDSPTTEQINETVRNLRPICACTPLPPPFSRVGNRKKYDLWVQQDGRCAYCEVQFLKYEDCTFDHIIPCSKGGKSKMSNLRLACKKCNGMKGSMTSYEEAVKEAEERITFFKILKNKGFIQ